MTAGGARGAQQSGERAGRMARGRAPEVDRLVAPRVEVEGVRAPRLEVEELRLHARLARHSS